VEAVNVLDGVEGIGRVTFKDVDVVRHDLVRRIVTAYDADAAAAIAPARKGGREP